MRHATQPVLIASGALAALVLALTPAAAVSAEGPASGPAPSRAEAEAWTVALSLPAAVKPGAPAVAQVLVTARAGHHVNLEYPFSFKPSGSVAATFSGERVALKAGEQRACPGRPAEPCEVVLPIPFTPGSTSPRVSGTVAFSVCSADRCLIERVVLSSAAPAGR